MDEWDTGHTIGKKYTTGGGRRSPKKDETRLKGKDQNKDQGQGKRETNTKTTHGNNTRPDQARKDQTGQDEPSQAKTRKRRHKTRQDKTREHHTKRRK